MADRLIEIRERWAAATPGPWASHDLGVYEGSVTDCKGPTVICRDPEMDDRPRDRAAIAEAPEDVAWLLAEVERLRAREASWRESLGMALAVLPPVSRDVVRGFFVTLMEVPRG